MRIGGARSAGLEDWDPNLGHTHWLGHGGCRRYREQVLLTLRDGVRSLGALEEVKFEGLKRDGLDYLMGNPLAGNHVSAEQI